MPFSGSHLVPCYLSRTLKFVCSTNRQLASRSEGNLSQREAQSGAPSASVGIGSHAPSSYSISDNDVAALGLVLGSEQ